MSGPEIVPGDDQLVGHGEDPRVRHRPRLPPRLLGALRADRELAGEGQSFGRRTALEAALRGGPQPVGEAFDGGGQFTRIAHPVTLRAAPGLLPTGERPGTVA